MNYNWKIYIYIRESKDYKSRKKVKQNEKQRDSVFIVDV